MTGDGLYPFVYKLESVKRFRKSQLTEASMILGAFYSSFRTIRGWAVQKAYGLLGDQDRKVMLAAGADPATLKRRGYL
ncbi:hypothetical protein HCH_02879 [Hahella chejuensis KCTC 2396]|uniref:Uncharacterized protein n=1 Tax=Hahella chejuensis (strain KCTC 2396) TaxID=349521 RepID=Q2SI69_HAHCH|nr:hypothetical protein HCH_02879 [Hahella chejuensis KCTC 2396]